MPHGETDMHKPPDEDIGQGLASTAVPKMLQNCTVTGVYGMNREEAALDEAMLPEDMFRQKMDMMLQLQRQQDALKTRMQALPPDQRQRFMQTQQVLIAQMQQQVLQKQHLADEIVLMRCSPFSCHSGSLCIEPLLPCHGLVMLDSLFSRGKG